MLRTWLMLLLLCCSTLAEARSCAKLQVAGLLDTEQLWLDFTALASERMQGRKAGGAGSVQAQQYIVARFRQLGLQAFSQYPDYRQAFEYRTASKVTAAANLLAWQSGRSKPEQFIVLTAHYDHLGAAGKKIYYGADDNASGVAAMLAIAQAIVGQGSEHSVVFLATDAEEAGLKGARYFMQHAPLAKDAMLVNINLDMLAEGGRRHRLYMSANRGNESARDYIEQVIQQAGMCVVQGHGSASLALDSHKRYNWRRASDHAVFADNRIDYVFIGGAIHSRYHTPEDKSDYINPEFYSAAVESAWLLWLAYDRSQ